MRVSGRRIRAIGCATMGLLFALAPFSSASAYLYWSKPDFSGPPVTGNEPGVVLPLPGATPAEQQAGLVWTLRAALNIAALQCQFSSPLMTVRTYNILLSQHGKELSDAYQNIGKYFKRTGGKTWQRSFDAYSTRTYNGLSTLHAQIGFCETAGKVGKLALAQPRGQFYGIAQRFLSEVRNSLIPAGDIFFQRRVAIPRLSGPPLDDRCWDRKGQLKKKCEIG